MKLQEESRREEKKKMKRFNDAVGGDSADLTDLTDKGNHHRVISAVFANSSAAFSCKNDESLLSESQCVFPYSSLAPPAALLQKLMDSHKTKSKAGE